jgi:hypothetical protein
VKAPSLFDLPLRFDGPAYDPALDQERLSKQLARVFDAMGDGAWRTLQEIADINRLVVGHSEGAV